MAACSGVWGQTWGRLMTQSAGSVTAQSIAIRYMITAEPYMYNWYLKQGLAGLPYIKIYYFFKHLSVDSKMFLNVIQD